MGGWGVGRDGPHNSSTSFSDVESSTPTIHPLALPIHAIHPVHLSTTSAVQLGSVQLSMAKGSFGPMRADSHSGYGSDSHSTDSLQGDAGHKSTAQKLVDVIPTPLLLATLRRTPSALTPSITPRSASLPATELAASNLPSRRPRIDRYMYGALKPTFRGVLHELLAYAMLPYTLYLLHLSYPSPLLLTSSAIYALSLTASLVASALYHRVQWRSVEWEELSRKADHLSIFMVGAGSGTPFALLLLLRSDPSSAVWLLIFLWGVPCVAAMRLWHRPSPEVAWTLTWVDDALHALHPVVTAPFMIRSFQHLPPDMVMMVLGTWLLYGIGFCVYAWQRPVCWPRVFGYHEVFHVIISSGFVLSMFVQARIVEGVKSGRAPYV